MGTFDDSKFRVARKTHGCDFCGYQIAPGEEYLSYAYGQRWKVPVHLDCATTNFGRYRCRVVEERIASS